MLELDATSLFVGFLTDAAYLAGIPLLVATVAALIVAVFQAMTQIQDQNLSQTVKIISIVLVFVIAGTSLVKPLLERTEQVFSQLDMY